MGRQTFDFLLLSCLWSWTHQGHNTTRQIKVFKIHFQRKTVSFHTKNIFLCFFQLVFLVCIITSKQHTLLFSILIEWLLERARTVYWAWLQKIPPVRFFWTTCNASSYSVHSPSSQVVLNLCRNQSTKTGDEEPHPKHKMAIHPFASSRYWISFHNINGSIFCRNVTWENVNVHWHVVSKLKSIK